MCSLARLLAKRPTAGSGHELVLGGSIMGTRAEQMLARRMSSEAFGYVFPIGMWVSSVQQRCANVPSRATAPDTQIAKEAQ